MSQVDRLTLSKYLEYDDENQWVLSCQLSTWTLKIRDSVTLSTYFRLTCRLTLSTCV